MSTTYIQLVLTIVTCLSVISRHAIVAVIVNAAGQKWIWERYNVEGDL